MSLLAKILFTSVNSIIPEIQYLSAGLIIQSVYILVLLEIIALMKVDLNKKKVFILSSAICSAVSLAVSINNSYSASTNFQIQPFEMFIVWTLICVLMALVKMKPTSGN